MPTGASEPAGPAADSDGGSGRDRYLLGCADPDLLTELAARLAGDDRVRVRRAPAVGVLAIEATPGAVAALRAEYGDRVVVEPDAPLELLPVHQPPQT